MIKHSYKIFYCFLIVIYACNYQKKDVLKDTIKKFVFIEDTSIRIKQLPVLSNCDLFGGIKSGISKKELNTLLKSAIIERKFIVDSIQYKSCFCTSRNENIERNLYDREGIYFNFLNDSGWKYGFRFEKFNSFNRKIFMITLNSENLNYYASSICEKFISDIISSKYGKPYYENKLSTYHYKPTADEHFNTGCEFINYYPWIAKDSLRQKICVEVNTIFWRDECKTIELESNLIHCAGDYGYNLIRPITIIFKDNVYDEIEKLLINEKEKQKRKQEEKNRDKIRIEINKIKKQI